LKSITYSTCFQNHSRRDKVIGTRGTYGFYKDGVTKVTYNHWDSYPSSLGDSIKDFLVNTKREQLDEIFDRIRLVRADEKPTSEDIEKLKPFYNGDVNGGSEEYYNFLRETQGDLKAYVDYPELDVMIDSEDFLQDSLFCEWAYIINLENDTLEIYKGFQTEPSTSRYENEETIKEAKEKSMKMSMDTYYAVSMIKEVPLSEIKDFDMEKFEEELNED